MREVRIRCAAAVGRADGCCGRVAGPCLQACVAGCWLLTQAEAGTPLGRAVHFCASPSPPPAPPRHPRPGSLAPVRRSCPDATGLGVDIARMLLDFGLRILKGDISTDGQWCFIIFKVCLSSGARGECSGQGAAGPRTGCRHCCCHCCRRCCRCCHCCCFVAAAAAAAAAAASLSFDWEPQATAAAADCASPGPPPARPQACRRAGSCSRRGWRPSAPLAPTRCSSCGAGGRCPRSSSPPCCRCAAAVAGLPADLVQSNSRCKRAASGEAQVAGGAVQPPHLCRHPALLVAPTPLPAPQVAGYDRQGMLHSLSHALWESDTTVGGAPPLPAGAAAAACCCSMAPLPASWAPSALSLPCPVLHAPPRWLQRCLPLRSPAAMPPGVQGAHHHQPQRPGVGHVLAVRQPQRAAREPQVGAGAGGGCGDVGAARLTPAAPVPARLGPLPAIWARPCLHADSLNSRMLLPLVFTAQGAGGVRPHQGGPGAQH